MPSNKPLAGARRPAFALLLASACSGNNLFVLDAGMVDSGGNQGPGASCATNADCSDNICFGGHCCSAACLNDPQHPECTSCDISGNCQYPQAICVAASCNPVTKVATQATTCSQGQCGTPITQTCSASCNGDACGAGCGHDQDCAPGFRCAVPSAGDAGPLGSLYGLCVARGSGGAACDHADECGSGVCLNGVCCNQQCNYDPQHLECVRCGSGGECLYPSNPCQEASCDSATNVFRAPLTCEQGLCPIDAGTALACGDFACSAVSGCAAACYSGADCAATASCIAGSDSTKGGQCCAAILQGAHLYADIATGSDSACCGTNPHHPCQTIAYTLELLAKAQASNAGTPITQVTLELSVNGDGGDWNQPLGACEPCWASGCPIPGGVAVHAPDVQLLSLTPVAGSRGPNGPEPVSIHGDPGHPVTLGYSAAGLPCTDPRVAVSPVQPSADLRLTNARTFNALGSFGPRLDIGLDETGDAGGTVDAYDGVRAVYFEPALGFSPRNTAGQCIVEAVVQDHGTVGQPALRIHRTQFDGGLAVGLQVLDCGSADLTISPQLGGATDGGSIGTYGVEVLQGGKLHLANGQIEGFDTAGVLFSTAVDAGGDLRIENSTISNNGCYGIYGHSGHFALRHSVVTDNYIGVGVVDPTLCSGASVLCAGGSGPFVDLSSGDGGANTIACNSTAFAALHPSDPDNICGGGNWIAAGYPAIDVWNRSASAVLAEQVAWSADPPSGWACANLPDLQSCDGGAVPAARVADGGPLNAVVSGAGAIDTARPAAKAVCR